MTKRTNEPRVATERDWLWAVGLTMAMTSGAYAIALAVRGTGLVAAALAIYALVVGGLAYTSRTRGSGVGFAHAMIAASAALLTTSAMLTGQADSVFTWALLLIPGWGIIADGRRGAQIWVIVTMLCISCLYVGESAFPIEPHWEPTLSEILISQMLLVALIAVVVDRSWNQLKGRLKATLDRQIALQEESAELTKHASELTRARDAAIEAAHVRAQFLANMSHEIRTPLNGVIGMANILRTTELDGEQRNMVRTMYRSGAALLAIVNDVLDLSKLEAGQVELEEEAFDVFECIEDALDVFATDADERDIDLAYVADDDVPEVIIGDITRLRQVVVNLVSNALKFTERGSVTVSVRSIDYETMEVSVADTGIGIPQENIERLFEAFKQQDSSTTRKFGGTGLGLTICRRLVNLMGGALTVSSVVGEGSTFSFRFRAPPSGQVPSAAASTQPFDARLLMQLPVVLSVREGPTLDAMRGHLRRVGAQVYLHQNDRWPTLRVNAPLFIVEWRNGSPSVTREEILSRYENARVLVMAPFAQMRTRGELRKHFDGEVHRPIRRNQLYGALERMSGLDEHAEMTTGSLDVATISQDLPLTILLAEDNPVNQEVALATLELLGYKADVAENGEDVLSAVRVREYDVILMDMHMPVVDGLQATQAIRDDETLTRQPWIVALTANVFPAQRRSCIEAGMNDFIPKPFSIEQLRDALIRVREAADGDIVMAQAPASRSDALSRLRMMTASKPGAYAKLIRGHLDNGASLMSKIEAHLRDQDGEELHAAAHTLKGSARMFGSIQVGDVCEALEELALSGNWGAVSDKVGRLRASWGAAVERLTRELARAEAAAVPPP